VSSGERGPPRGRFIPIRGGRYDTVGEDEAAAVGRALIAQIRGDPLTPAERALLARMRSSAAEDARAPTPVVDASETLATFERGADAELRVTWRRFKGSAPFLDIRRWERTADGTRPTRQGVTIRARELSRFVSAVLSAVRRVGGGVAEDA
jgi:hypothetical protein